MSTPDEPLNQVLDRICNGHVHIRVSRQSRTRDKRDQVVANWAWLGPLAIGGDFSFDRHLQTLADGLEPPP